ncbi:MAG TPA: DUF1223 domain-containing protein [Methylibium sp.]
MKLAIAALSCAFALLPGLSPAAPSCSANSGAMAPLLVELYTSEGCNSCPPADRWLSSIAKSRSDVIALAFHVDYWDSLGWKDRFADAAYTRRQYEIEAGAGSRFAYTPQVLLNGRDYRSWPFLPAPAGAALVNLSLAHEGSSYVARLTRLPAARGGQLLAYWAVTEDSHVSAVKAGENAGATLKHDAVVREYRAPQRLDAADELTLRFEPRVGSEAGHARHVVLVITDARSGQVVQAAQVDC